MRPPVTDKNREGCSMQWQAAACHDSLDSLIPELENRLMSSEYPLMTKKRIQLICEELMTNTIKYGYPCGRKGSFKLAIDLHKDHAEIIYCDDGIAFDPTHVPEVDTELDVMDRAIGGLGLHLIARLCSSSIYRRTEGENRLWLRLDIAQEA